MLAIERTDEFCDPFMKKCVKIISKSISVRIWLYLAAMMNRNRHSILLDRPK